MSTTAPLTRHTVTALIVAHDGARLLPGLVQALSAQTYPVEQTVGVDTGSRDRSGAVLAELIGRDAVFGMSRSTGYGEAVAVALGHATRRQSGMTDPNLTRVETWGSPVVGWVKVTVNPADPKLFGFTDHVQAIVP